MTTARAVGMDGEIASSPRSEQGEYFPLSMTLQVLGVAMVLFSVIPYLGITMRPAPRTDLGWWRDGIVLNGIVKLDEMKVMQSLGFVGVKLVYPHTQGPDATHGHLLQDIRATGMKVIVTLAVDGEDRDLYRSLQEHVEEWLSAGVDGISLSLTRPYVPVDGLTLHNLTAAIRRRTEQYTDHADSRIALEVESGRGEELVAAMDGGADVVLGGGLCSPHDSQRTSQVITATLSQLEERGDQMAAAWTVCPSAQYSEVLSLLSLLLPGVPLATAAAVPRLHLSGVLELKAWPALRWGSLETVLVDKHLYSYVLWAKGRMYDKLFVVVNLGGEAKRANFVKKLDKFTVAARGRVVLVGGAESMKKGTVVDMDSLEVNAGELLVIHFPPLGV